MKARVVAAHVLVRVINQGRSLSDVLPGLLAEVEPAQDRALTQELCYGVLRWYPQLEALALRLLRKAFKGKDADVFQLVLLGLYQLIHLRVPAHAAVSLTVEAVEALQKPWAKALVNAVLRNYQRHPQLLEEVNRAEHAAHAHPPWWLEKLKESWPQDWPLVAAANNARAPMTLRVNPRKCSRDDYLAALAQQGMNGSAHPHASQGVVLAHPADVLNLPGFAQGWVSVQDAGAQLAAALLDAQPGERVLDACAAPGGKTGHILERSADLREVVAIDLEAARARQIQENLARLELTARVIVADAGRVSDWWDGASFDRILLDVPCSASGVIRRHPDIKYLRRAEDLAPLVERQARLLEALWPVLRSGGRLLYATCSVLRAENDIQMQNFCARQVGAHAVPLPESWGRAQAVGRQILPGEADMDGFYYACIGKN